MYYKKEAYVDLKYKPSSKDLVAEYYVEPNRMDLRTVANHIAAESSIGTWTQISTMSPTISKRLRPSVFYINKKKNIIKVAYHAELFEKGNMPQILSSIAGNIYGMKAVKKLKLLDITFPKVLVKSFKGPKFGIQGVRKILDVKRRPLVGTIVKPKVGLSAKKHAEVAFNSWMGGLDCVKDDENLSSQTFNKFKKRIELTEKARFKAEKITGEKKVYMPNITAETEEMLRRMKFVEKNHGNYVMIDILTLGFAAFQTVRNHSKLPIHCHRAMHAAFTRGNHGISMLTLAKISRLLGGDTLHIGTAYVGKMSESKKSTLDIEKEIEKRFVKEHGSILKQNWFGIKPVLAVASGGLHPGHIPKLVKMMGNNILIQAGGGVHFSPEGTIVGAKAMRQAVTATMRKIPLKKYAKTHSELEIAIKKFGVAK
ncbi:type III ribulose-bisphosphate carboxylase [archaeon]|nr:type III ribulose-bisphosphate carboxylase [archaeon]